MDLVAKLAIFIVTYAFNKCQFTNLLDAVDSQFLGLIMYNNVRCLSHDKVFNLFLSLDEIK